MTTTITVTKTIKLNKKKYLIAPSFSADEYAQS